MKSIKQQYIDLQEGNMSQANFMRNIRMTLPHLVTNVTSFEDSVRILKNKGILTEADIKVPSETVEKVKKVIKDLTAKNEDYHRDGYTMGFFEGEDVKEEEEGKPLNEAKDEKGKWTNANGKSMYDQFKELDNLNGHEVAQGIDWEMQCNPELSKKDIIKKVIKNLKKNPIYYTSWDMSGVEGYEPETMGPKADIEARQMQYLDKNMGNVVDKKMGMKPVKDVEKVKKDADAKKETNTPEKGISLMSLIAKTVRGVKKMDATGEKMKKISMNEVRLNDFPNETPGKIATQIKNFVDSNPTLKQYSDEITLQSDPDGFLRYGYWDSLPSDAVRALELQFDVKEDSDFDEDKGTLIFYMLTPKHSAGTVNLGKADLMNMIREEIKEMFDGMEPMDRKGLDETKLSPEEQKIANDILNTLDEGMFNDVLEKVKSYAKKGLMTAAILGALLSAPNFSQAQQQQIKQAAQTEMSSIQKMDDMSLGNALIKKYEKNPKAAEEWQKKHKATSLITNIKSVIKTGKDQGEIKDLGNMYQNNKDAQGFLTYTVDGNTAYIQENNIDLSVNEALKKFRKGK